MSFTMDLPVSADFIDFFLPPQAPSTSPLVYVLNPRFAVAFSGESPRLMSPLINCTSEAASFVLVYPLYRHLPSPRPTITTGNPLYFLDMTLPCSGSSGIVSIKLITALSHSPSEALTGFLASCLACSEASILNFLIAIFLSPRNLC